MPPTSAEIMQRFVECALRWLPFAAANIEISLGMPAGSSRDNRALVAEKVSQQPRLLQLLMQVGVMMAILPLLHCTGDMHSRFRRACPPLVASPAGHVLAGD